MGSFLFVLLRRVGTETTDSHARTARHTQLLSRRCVVSSLALKRCPPLPTSTSHSLPREKLVPLVLAVLKVLKVLVASLAIPGPLGPQVLL